MTRSTSHVIVGTERPFARTSGCRLARLTLAASALLMCGGWAGSVPAGASSLPPAIVVVARPDNRSVAEKYGREIVIGAGAVLGTGFFLRKMTHRRGSDE